MISNKHDFLRMNLPFRKDKKFSIGITQLFTEVVKEFSETPTSAIAPTRSDFFEVGNNLLAIDKDRRELFHRLAHEIYFCLL